MQWRVGELHGIAEETAERSSCQTDGKQKAREEEENSPSPASKCHRAGAQQRLLRVLQQ